MGRGTRGVGLGWHRRGGPHIRFPAKSALAAVKRTLRGRTGTELSAAKCYMTTGICTLRCMKHRTWSCSKIFIQHQQQASQHMH